MFASVLFINKVARTRVKTVSESYDYNDKCCPDNTAVSPAAKAFLVIFASIFFLIELVLLFFAIKIALHQTEGSERVVNLILAVIVPIPYVLLKLVMTPSVTKAALSSNFSLG